ncbi:MAG: hypothetical protein DMD98_14980 [Candidatus Rokuibacteriota bacterium]|jgi:hypothetical protein|nr:MAG: hypothetical protein DMD98_14980 [Candidatus Rokubacteria bacterium]
MSGSQNGIRDTAATMRELLAFFWHGKVWWLTPLIVLLFVLTFLIVFAQSSAVAPFIYALF